VPIHYIRNLFVFFMTSKQLQHLLKYVLQNTKRSCACCMGEEGKGGEREGREENSVLISAM
jgi:hypothetical protein